ncbi:MAG: phosphopentomutase [Desulfuromonadales bacterium]|jgi:phosphopentomutase
MSAPRGRVIWIVLDGVGLKALPDAAAYGDAEAATLPHVAAACGGLSLPYLQKLGLGCLGPIEGVAAVERPIAAYGCMAEQAAGKDSIVGHWELAGVIVDTPFATYPEGFPADLVQAFTDLCGVPPLGNVAAGGVSILKKFGAEHLRTGRPILYTSVDSVFQVAAHEAILPPAALYDLCRAIKGATEAHGIARVIARPFTGNGGGGFRRTAGRKDFPTPPPSPTLLDNLAAAGIAVVSVGKIADLFTGRGIRQSVTTADNRDGMKQLLAILGTFSEGLLMANLIDFDMAYGHRRDANGFGRALQEFDAWLPHLEAVMRPEDVLVITADHGCDPTTPGTDHTREYVPLLVWSKRMTGGVDLGTRATFADLAATLADYFCLQSSPLAGESFLLQTGL